jgi:hypothetical protein
LAHTRAEAYQIETPLKPVGLDKIRKDLCVKLLASGSRHFLAGLMLHQRPYLVVTKDQIQYDQPWLKSIYQLYDCISDSSKCIDDRQYDSDDSESDEEDGSDRVSELSVHEDADGNNGGE